jgi:hypothetical protein
MSELLAESENESKSISPAVSVTGSFMTEISSNTGVLPTLKVMFIK